MSPFETITAVAAAGLIATGAFAFVALDRSRGSVGAIVAGLGALLGAAALSAEPALTENLSLIGIVLLSATVAAANLADDTTPSDVEPEEEAR